jgi:hypothetical protein
MGGLIQTRGTHRLVNHYNHIFNAVNIGDTKTAILNDAQPNVGLLDLFRTSSANARMIRDITQRQINTGQPVNRFLPLPTGHPNLLRRWDFDLQVEFDQANQERLRALIAQVLNLANPSPLHLGTNQDNITYASIRFECIEANQGQTQTILQSDEYDLLSNNNDSGLSRASAYSKIVLVTDPISNAAPVPPDNQNIQ